MSLYDYIAKEAPIWFRESAEWVAFWDQMTFYKPEGHDPAIVTVAIDSGRPPEEEMLIREALGMLFPRVGFYSSPYPGAVSIVDCPHYKKFYYALMGFDHRFLWGITQVLRAGDVARFVRNLIAGESRTVTGWAADVTIPHPDRWNHLVFDSDDDYVTVCRRFFELVYPGVEIVDDPATFRVRRESQSPDRTSLIDGLVCKLTTVLDVDLLGAVHGAVENLSGVGRV